MIDNTINDDKTVACGGKDVTLAGRYHIIRQLGQGGMGAVWLAEDLQLDNRKVAIKMLPTIIVQDKRAYQQLKGEALVSLKLIHPNIVTLRAFEENDGAPFLVMDYIEGRTLNDYLAVKGKLSEEETIKLLKPIAAALDYAHGEKVVHRDIKPSNILIRNDGHPFILDFGIAREIQESMTRMTGGTISGTLLYMAPEQLRGAPPKPAQDVYSFSAMAYECLTGQPPFIRGQIEYQILNERPAPLPGKSRFGASIMAGLAKNPEDRPKSCSAVLGMEYLSQRRRGVEIHSASRLTRKGKWAKKALWVTGVVLAVAVIASLCCGIVAYKKKQNTNRFLTLFNAKWYDAAAQLINKIDGTDARVQFSLGEMYSNGNGVAKDETGAIGWYRKAAEQGDAEAQERLGTMYRVGQGVIKDGTAAVKWYHKAADQGRLPAQCMLGFMYRFGDGVAKNEAEAVKWYKKAAEQGNSLAIDMLAEMYQHGLGVSKDEKYAAELYRKAAEQGYAEAQFNLGTCYSRGNGVPKSVAEALKWYRKAAEQGHTEAEYNMGWYCEVFSPRKDEAVKWYERAAKKNHAQSIWSLGQCYDTGCGVETNKAIAIQYYKKAAALGDSNGRFSLAMKYYSGDGIEKNYTEAARLFHLAAEQGYDEAQYYYAVMCLKGLGIPRNTFYAAYWFGKAEERYRSRTKFLTDANTAYALATILMNKQGNDADKKEAISWYRKAAEQGNAEAQCALGFQYWIGELLEKDYAEAFKWIYRAANQGLARAQNLLGVMYAEGVGTGKNDIEAVRWYRKAAEQGDDSAQTNLATKYFDGVGVEKNDNEAIRWVYKAAEQGSVVAFSLLGWAYESGRGVKRDIDEAIKWYKKAADLGYESAKKSLDRLSRGR